MNDPFFDEDDGEFDDLYGNPSLSMTSPTVRQKAYHNEVSEAPSGLLNVPSSVWSPVASKSGVSAPYARDRTDSTTSNTTDLATSGKHERRREKRGKMRHKGSQKLFGVQWESDVQVDKCGLCKSDFSLVRRKHHCRHCGRIVCSDCSYFLYFELSRRKHRVCSTCNNQLLAEQDAYEREAMTAGGDTTSDLFVGFSDDGRAASSAQDPKCSEDNEDARKKQEEDSHKEQKSRDKLQKQGRAAKGLTTATTFRDRALVVGNNHTTNGTAVLEDSSNEDWFTDVPDQPTGARDKVDAYSVDGGSKGSGWKDRGMNTFTVTPATAQTSMIVPRAGSLLSVGILGKGETSDQFRYDVSGPGCGHDDDISCEMPRPKQPKQQSETSTHTDRSVKPIGLLGKGSFSEQFQYDDVGGPGLGHEYDRIVSMPRPKQPLATTSYSYNSARYSQKQSSTDDSTFHEPGSQTRPTFVKMWSQELTSKKKERKAKANNPQKTQGNQNMTLDELNSSYSSHDGSRTLAAIVPKLTTAEPTFYDQDADELLVDELPGYFEATMEEREEQRKKEEEQYEHLARDMAWANNILSLPTSGQPHCVSNEQDSYGIVNISSLPSNPSIGNQGGDVNDTGASGKAKSGFTGALKRFLGMGSKKATAPPKPAKQKVPSKSAKTPHAAMVAATSEKDTTENHTSPRSGTNYHDSTITIDTVSGGLLRHTVEDYHGVDREEPVPQARSRNTMKSHVDSSPRVEVSLSSQVGELEQYHQKQESERKRRGTFDELFMSPKDNLAIDNILDRFSTGGSRWTAHVEETTNAGRMPFGAVGVARFDQRRPGDKAEEFVLGNGSPVVPSSQPADHSTEAWRESAALSLLNDKNVATLSEEVGFTWSNIGPASGLGTATYAVPTSLQPRAFYSNTTGVSIEYEAPATLGSIMDDMECGSALRKSQGKESIDDFYSEFEETNDYVFDTSTGGYVASRAPVRAVATSSVKQINSAELLVPEKVTSRTSDHGYNAPSPIAGITIATSGDSEGVEDDVAEIIVDKISSLESELAALKQLIRIRKGSGGNQSSKPRVSRSTAKPSVRKESIFNNGSSDGSDEDNDKNASYGSLVRPVGSKRRPDSKKKFAKTRKDSFADLFEDSPNDHKVFGRATSYEDLFQTEAKLTEISKEDVSNDDVNSIRSPRSRAAKPRRLNRKTNDFVLSNDSDSEPELTSVKERRDRVSSRGNTREDVDDASLNMNEGKLVTLPSRMGAKQGSTNKQVDEDDSIDALFDTSNDRDVTDLYDGHDGHDGKDMHSVLESSSASKGRSISPSQKSSSGTETRSGAITVNMESVAPVSTADASHSYALDLQGLGEADEEEDHLIDWSKMRKTKPRRRQYRVSSNTVDESHTTDSTSKSILLEPSLFSEDSINDVRAEHAVPTAFLADASSSWMSVGALEHETASVSLTSGELKLQPFHESEHMTESATVAVVTSTNKQDDGADAVSASAPLNPVPVVETVLSPKAKAVLTGEAGDLVEHLPVANLALVEKSSDTIKKVVRQNYAAFDIFDKSGDVEFSSISLPMDSNTPDQEEVGIDGENDNKESLFGNDEAFSFEIQAPKKRFSEDVPTTISSVQSMPHISESPPPSTDDGVEFGKYATYSVPLTSDTSSIDGNFDDVEDTMVDDDPVLGKVESQAFDTDWLQMQAEEKERKKRLQVKQRQAQRDKLLRKQGASTKSLSGSTATHGSSNSKLKSGKKKKKDKEMDDTTSSSSHHKKSYSSRKYRRNATDSAFSTPSAPPRVLTEL